MIIARLLENSAATSVAREAAGGATREREPSSA
jgi:hypothetical protein